MKTVRKKIKCESCGKKFINDTKLMITICQNCWDKIPANTNT